MTVDSKLLKYYLPHEMQVIGFPYAFEFSEKRRYSVRGTMVGLRSEFCYVKFQDENGRKCDKDQQMPFVDVVPLLRPLEYLVKPCPDGTVPLVELAKFYHDFEISNFTLKNGPYDERRGYAFDFTKDGPGLFDFRYIPRKMSFYDGDYGGSYGGSEHPCAHQIQLFEKMFAWHFDVFGMIKEGFAQSLYEEKNKNILPFLSCRIDR